MRLVVWAAFLARQALEVWLPGFCDRDEGLLVLPAGLGPVEVPRTRRQKAMGMGMSAMI